MLKLTRKMILNEPVGRKLDSWVAEKVMGWKRSFDPRPSDIDGPLGWWFGDPLERNIGEFCPSTDISAAMEVAEKIDDCFHLCQHGEEGRWKAFFCGFPGSIVHGDTAPEAICKAALLAKVDIGILKIRYCPYQDKDDECIGKCNECPEARPVITYRDILRRIRNR